MIGQDTTLVLGAGASAPYGFPSGQTLLDEVIKTFSSGNNDKVKILEQLGHTRQDIERFAQALRRSGKGSVDAFLEHRSDMVNLGKAAMAACLIPYEIEEKFSQPNANWYRWLYTALNAPPDRFAKNRLRIVTFNYDRSLEHYLFNALTATYNLESDKAANLVQSIPLVHLHGKLGRLPWQPGGGGSREYNTHLSPGMIQTARDSIQVIHEERYDSAALEEAQAHIRNSKRVVFVGFGYHPENLARLHIDLESDFDYVGGSGLGLTKLEKEKAGRRLPKGFDWGADVWGALDFLRNKVDLE
jgi:hypothetical protein